MVDEMKMVDGDFYDEMMDDDFCDEMMDDGEMNEELPFLFVY